MKSGLHRVLAGIVLWSVSGVLMTAGQMLHAAEDTRLPVPPQEKVDESLVLVRAAYEADYRAAKESGEPEQLIAQLSDLARREADSVRKYALFLEAENVAAGHGNYKKAVQLLEERVERFREDGIALKRNLLKRLAGPKGSAELGLYDEAIDAGVQAMRSECFEVAAEAAALAVSLANAIEREQKGAVRKQRKNNESNIVVPQPIGGELVKKATALQSQITATKKLFEQYSDALEEVKVSPDSPSANAVIGTYLCFVRQDWKAGLLALAKSDLKEFSSLAANEMELAAAPNPIDAQKAFALAGKWWAAAESKEVPAEYESVIKDHAAGYYTDAADQLTSTLEKRLAVSRLRGFRKRGPSKGKPEMRLSELPIKRSLVGWDRLRVGKLPDVNVNNTVPESAIYAHASSLVVFSLPSSFDGTLVGSVALAGLSHKIVSPGSCRFRILGDDTLLWESGVITQDKKTGDSIVEQFNVRVSGFKTVGLEVDSLGANHSDWSVWVDPVLYWSGTTKSSQEKKEATPSGTTGNPDGLDPEQLQTRYWKIVNAALPDGRALNVYNDDGGRGRCVAFVGKWGPYTGQLWSLQEPGVFTCKFLGRNRILSVDASGEAYMAFRQPGHESFRTVRNPDGESFKVQSRGGYLSVEERDDGQDVRVVFSAHDLGKRSDWIFVPTGDKIDLPEVTRPEKAPREAVRFNGKWFWFSDQQATPIEAAIKAAELGGVLAVVSSGLENEFFKTRMRGPTLLGIKRAGEQWITEDGKPLEYSNWGRNQPDNKKGMGQDACVLQENGRWHDQDMGGKYYFAVQWQ